MKNPRIFYHGIEHEANIKTLSFDEIDGVELDLRMTRDRVVVMSHDRRVQHGDARYYWIDKLTYKELVDIKGSSITTFESVLKELSGNPVAHKLTLDLDLKQSGMEGTIVPLLQKFRFNKIMVSSPDVWILSAFERLMPEVDIELTYHPNERWDLWNIRAFRYLSVLVQFSLKPFLLRLIRRKTVKRDIDYASISYRLVSPEVVTFFHEYDIKILAWGNDSEKQLRRLIQLKVDGIKTRKPELLTKILNSKPQAPNKF